MIKSSSGSRDDRSRNTLRGDSCRRNSSRKTEAEGNSRLELTSSKRPCKEIGRVGSIGIEFESGGRRQEYHWMD